MASEINRNEEEFYQDEDRSKNNIICLKQPIELVKYDDVPDEYETDLDDKQIRRFRKRKTGLGWLEGFIYNLKKNELSVVECINNPANKIQTQLIFVTTCLDIDEHGDKMFYKGSPHIATKAPSNNRTVTTVGQYLKGGLKLFYFFDVVSMRRGKGMYGEYIMMKWKNMQKHLDHYATVVSHKFNCEGAVLNNTAFLSVPADETPAKAAFVKKFYEIRFTNNRLVFSTDDVVKTISCEEMSVDRFNELLFLGEDTTEKKTGHISDTECLFLMGAIIEGFKSSKNESLYSTLDGKNNSDFTYSLAIVPQVLFYINSDNSDSSDCKRAKPSEPECIIQESL
ncbi:DBP [Rachiplusia nu nucleopolyhedrovirus]|uniref:DBP n=1 Tax=Rachiplusia nu nucleopolyhedrovirus TaxID=2605775 RepID=A0AAE6IRE5_9ABAC|nr:DBP [Rachiplusia nu nucleopolyhedrovirus]QEI03648.1 DBP [Rachiplusia nu nucleopolyhedrovirus]